MYDKILPASEGILRCLQALAEETLSLGLARTHVALEHAISMCRDEASRAPAVERSPSIGSVH